MPVVPQGRRRIRAVPVLEHRGEEAGALALFLDRFEYREVVLVVLQIAVEVAVREGFDRREAAEIGDEAVALQNPIGGVDGAVEVEVAEGDADARLQAHTMDLPAERGDKQVAGRVAQHVDRRRESRWRSTERSRSAD